MQKVEGTRESRGGVDGESERERERPRAAEYNDNHGGLQPEERNSQLLTFYFRTLGSGEKKDRKLSPAPSSSPSILNFHSLSQFRFGQDFSLTGPRK